MSLPALFITRALRMGVGADCMTSVVHTATACGWEVVSFTYFIPVLFFSIPISPSLPCQDQHFCT